MKKLVSIILAVMMCMGLFAAASAEGELDHVDLTIALYEFTGFDDDLAHVIEDKFNCDITSLLLEGDMNAQLRLWAASDELPDVWAGTSLADGSRMFDFIDQGLIRSIPADMLAKYPNTEAKTLRNEVHKLLYSMTGEIYFIPRPESATDMFPAQVNYMAIRGDWLEKLELAVPETTEELYDVLYAFTYNDPDGDGEANTYGLFGSYDALYGSFGAFPGYWLTTDDGYIPGWLDEEPMLEALTYLRKLYADGILDPELTLRDDSKFAQGVFGAYIRNFDEYWYNRTIVEVFGGANEALGDPNDVIVLAGPFSKDAESPKQSVLRVDGISGNEYNADLSDEKLERLLMMDNWLLSQEGNDLMYWGIRDVDYTIDENGNYVMLETTPLRTKYPSIFIQNWPCWDYDYNAKPVTEGGSPYISEETKAVTAACRTRYNEALHPETLKISVPATYLYVDASADFTFDYNAALVKIITGTDDVKAMYDAMVEEAYSYGLQDLIDQRTEALK